MGGMVWEGERVLASTPLHGATAVTAGVEHIVGEGSSTLVRSLRSSWTVKTIAVCFTHLLMRATCEDEHSCASMHGLSPSSLSPSLSQQPFFGTTEKKSIQLL